MGALVWHDLARLLALTSALYVTWASLWAFAYRKFFWDFVGATLGPRGLVAALFIRIIVDIPILQIVNLLDGLLTLALEWPLPCLAHRRVHHSMTLRVGLYLWCALAASFVYQTAFVSLFYLVTASAYARVLAKGESLIPPARANPGSRGKV